LPIKIEMFLSFLLNQKRNFSCSFSLYLGLGLVEFHYDNNDNNILYSELKWIHKLQEPSRHRFYPARHSMSPGTWATLTVAATGFKCSTLERNPFWIWRMAANRKTVPSSLKAIRQPCPIWSNCQKISNAATAPSVSSARLANGARVTCFGVAQTLT
jgi:hypothetical protein